MENDVNLSQTMTVLVEKAAKVLEDVTVQYGPAAVDLALEVGRIAAINDIIWGLATLLLAGVLLTFAITLFRKVDWSEVDWGWSAKPDMGALCSTGCGFISLLFFQVASQKLIQVHAWVGMFKPEVYLAYTAIFG